LTKLSRYNLPNNAKDFGVITIARPVVFVYKIQRNKTQQNAIK